MYWEQTVPFFAENELACRCCGRIRMDIHLAVALPALRLAWNRPLYATSVCRCPAHNLKVGGHPRSMHLTENPHHPTDGAAAADISWASWDNQTRLDFCRLAYKHGWSVGLHDSFCHIDRRKDLGLPQGKFLYGQWSGGFNPEDIL